MRVFIQKMYSAELITTSNKEMDFQIKEVLSFLWYTYAGASYLLSMSSRMASVYFVNILQLKIVLMHANMSKIHDDICMSKEDNGCG